MGNYTAALEPGLQPHLDSGERLLCATVLTPDAGSTGQVDLRDELVNLLDPTLLIGGAHPGELLQRATLGRALLGGPASIAGRLHAAVDAAAGSSTALAVTDRRLLVVAATHVATAAGWRKWISAGRLEARLLHQVPRGEVVSAAPAPAGPVRARRIAVAFSDGSVCALVTALRAHAEHVVAELSRPSSPRELS